MSDPEHEIPTELQAKWRIGADGKPVRRRGQPQTPVDDLYKWNSQDGPLINFILDHPGPLKAAKADAMEKFRLSLRAVNAIWSAAGGKTQAFTMRDTVRRSLSSLSSDPDGNSTLGEDMRRAGKGPEQGEGASPITLHQTPLAPDSGMA